VFGLGLLIVADVILAMAVSPPLAFLGVAFWGLHMAFTQGLLSKLVADTAPSELLGTAFGVFTHKSVIKATDRELNAHS
jgi:hypothetical protein